MRKFFPEAYPLSDLELDDIWKNGIIIFDTNVLLRFFRYSSSTINEVFSVMSHIGARMWIPYHVGWEYNRNRLGKIREAKSVYDKIYSSFTVVVKECEDALRDVKEFGLHPSLQLEEKFVALNQSIQNSLKEIRSEYDGNPTDAHYSSIHNRIGEFFADKLGDEPEISQLAKLYADGKKRFEAGIPPGLKDVVAKRNRNASEREVYGDYIIWEAIVTEAKKKSKPVIFVTEDIKDDWWLRDGGQTVGALPELRKEFIQETAKHVVFYRVSSFLEASKKFLKSQVSANTMTDVNANSRSAWAEFEASVKSVEFLSKPNSELDSSVSRNELTRYIESERSRRVEAAKRKVLALDENMSMHLSDMDRIKGDLDLARMDLAAMRNVIAHQDPSAIPEDQWKRMTQIQSAIASLERSFAQQRERIRVVISEREALATKIENGEY